MPTAYCFLFTLKNQSLLLIAFSLIKIMPTVKNVAASDTDTTHIMIFLPTPLLLFLSELSKLSTLVSVLESESVSVSVSVSDRKSVV